MQPPEQRRGVDHVEHDARPAPAHLGVEETEHRLDVARLEMVEREVPPVVHLEEAVAGPLVVRPHPGDAVGLPVLHLHHVGDRVLRPAVPRLELDAPPPGRLGPGIVAGLLEPEGVHAEHRVIARHPRLPEGQRPRDPVAQHPRMPGEEVDLVPGEQPHGIARRLDRHVLQHPPRLVPAPLDEMPQRRRMALLPHRPGAARRLGLRLPRHGHPARLGPEQVQPALQRMRHGEARRLGERRIDPRHRIAAVALQLRHRRLVLRRRGLRGARQRQPVNVRPHRLPPCANACPMPLRREAALTS
jgi:hypothetical protein